MSGDADQGQCDETRPSCVNCKVASLECSYIKSAGTALLVQRPTSKSSSPLPPTPETDGSIAEKTKLIVSESTSNSVVNMNHLELLHHYETVTYQSFTTNTELALLFRETAVSNALQFPYLMYAILAIAAMQLSISKPEQSEHYHALATSLQAAGLSRIHEALLDINERNCVSVFLFSTTTGLHTFCETFGSRNGSFNTFMDKLTGCISMMRGIRSVLHGGWWAYLRGSNLSSLLAAGDALGCRDVDRDAETKLLWELLGEADVGASTLRTYEETVTSLQRVFNAERGLKDIEASVSMVFAWPVLLGTDYNELLVQRRPEALIILAYYGIVLHNRRKTWAVGDSGQFLVHAISEYLGQHWERWLVWPLTMVSSKGTATLPSPPDSTVPHKSGTQA